MMGLPIPKDITDRLDSTEAHMIELVTSINRVVELLEEQNQIMEGWNRRV